MAIVSFPMVGDIDSFMAFPLVRRNNSLKKEVNCLSEISTSAINGKVTSIINGKVKEIMFTPAVEIYENNNAIDLRLEIPGLEVKDLDVQVTAEAVEIKGKRRQETETQEQNLVRSEFHYGAFQRRISLPVRVQNNLVKADYKDGILHIHLPKSEADKNQVVKVNVG
ncbi:MAG: Hsp20/alpha crystallin family protein [Trichodesmium sp. St19_bin2]|nr:Hsp20/alpha crystallin family protein [Trichodesmium sp. St4_bin8_1]MDE5073730.1 Hsp20/alpha crystallin family protein [Trichodesmium sp. St5_bin8]MDE5091449.1 Hsp20/alpha crystallin family protein [Trichodesmium sp. St18_bin3_1_1]MDE5102963.1 Hsp20/alpha crystallin family protein [Trichodesmium sp. St19_bin2]